MENNFDQGMENNNMFNSNVQGSNAYNQGAMLYAEEKESMVKNLGMAAIAAIVGAIVAFGVSLFLYRLGYIAFISGLAGAGVAFFVYLKLAKEIKIAGMAIIAVLMLIGVYFGTSVGTIQSIQSEYEDTYGGELTYEKATNLHEFAMEFDSEYKMAYYKDLIMGELFAIGGCVAVVTSRMKKAK